MWFSRRAFLLHLTALVVVGACVWLGWWQFDRARSGNSLSWAYVFEWPIFAGYGTFMWWKMLHEPFSPSTGSERLLAPGNDLGTTGLSEFQRERQLQDEADDEELAAYNRYLAELSESDRQKSR